MPEFLSRLFDTAGFPPRWACGEWDPGHGWLHVLSDLGVWAAYLAIPGVLAWVAVRRPDLPFRRLFWVFGALLLASAATHLMDAVLFWWPAYRLAGVLKLAAATASWGGVLALVGVVPRVLAARSPADLEREIAARIRAEAVLRASEELNRTVIASAVDAIVTSNAEGVIIAWNRGAERMFGRPADDVVGRLFADVVTDEFALSPVAFSMPAELFSRRADGTTFPIELTLTVWQLDSGSFYTVIVRDVTERKQAEDQLRRTEARLRLSQDVARMGIWELDLATGRSAIDDRNREQLGFAPGEFDGTLAAVLARVHPDDRAGFVRALDPILVAKEMFEYEFRVAPRTPGEAVRWLAARGQFVTPVGGAAPRLVGVTFDVTDRRQAESDLRQADERFRAAFDSAPIGMALVATDGGFLKANQALGQMLGYTEDEFLDTDFQALTHPDDLDADVANVRRLLAGEAATYQMEKRYVRKDGAVIWGDLNVSAVRGPDGRVDYFVSQITDVTARKRAEQAERDRAAGVIRRQSALLDLEGADFPDLTAELTAVARAGFAGLGVDRVRVWLATPDRAGMECVCSYDGTPGGPPPLPRLVAADQPRFMAALSEGRVLAAADVRADPRTADLERAGVVLPDTAASLTAPARFQGRVIGMVVLVACDAPREWTADERDYAAVLADRMVVAVQADRRRRAEEAVHIRDRAIEAMPNGVVITDPNLPDNPAIYVNKGFEQITGYPAAEVLGRNVRFLQGPDTDPGVVAAFRAAVRDGRPLDAEVLNYKKDGTPFWNSMRIAPVTDDQGEVTHFVASQRDVTGFRRLEEQFRQSQKMEAVGHLAGGIAHDFNNLLNIINGYSEMLLAELPAGGEPAEYVTEIMDAGRRAADLTRQLLAFSRKQVLQPRPIALNDLVAGLNKMLARLIGEDIRLTTSLHPDLGLVMADPGQVEQALTNLVVNARDAMPTGGRLTIETFPAELDGAYASLRPDARPGRYALLAVSDTGAGMTEETKARLFEPFYTTKGQGKGTGLGLATVHGIVKQSGGHVEVYSEVGKGTTFKLFWPVADPGESDDPAPGPAKPAPPRGREAILLVEDEAKLRAMTATVLRAAGYTVAEAAGGAEAVRRFATLPGVDLLLTDVVMPDMGGRQLAQWLTTEAPGLRVLYMSGYTDDAVVRHGILAAEVAFLQKPFSTDGLLRKVRAVLDDDPGGSGAG